MTRIENIYDQREGETGERSARRLSWKRNIWQGGGGTVLAEEFNAQSMLRPEMHGTVGRHILGRNYT